MLGLLLTVGSRMSCWLWQCAACAKFIRHPAGCQVRGECDAVAHDVCWPKILFILRSLLQVNCKYYELLSPCHKLLCNKHAARLQYVSIHELAAGCEGPSLAAAWMLTACAAHSCILLCMHQELWYLPQTPIAYLQAMSSSPSADLGMRLPKLGDA